MKTHSKIITLLILCTLLNACTATRKNQRAFKYSVQAGINSGGIVENTDLTLVPNAQALPGANIDAYSGSTRTGYHAGIHVNKPLKYLEIEGGLDMMHSDQTFTYADKGNGFVGVRNFSVNQLIFPITCNFMLFRKKLSSAEIQVKLGYTQQINMISAGSFGMLPDYSLNALSQGGILGISAYPVRFKNGTKLGLYLNAYRGTQIYEDYYNQESFEMPGSSFISTGIRYRFH